MDDDSHMDATTTTEATMTYDQWKCAPSMRDDDDDRCATCLEECDLTHISPYGERICRPCAVAPEWAEDGLQTPTTIADDVGF